MGYPKRTGAVAIARTVSATATATPKHTLICDSGGITSKPFMYERTSLGADKAAPQPAGFDHSFSFSGAEVNCEQLGYLIWLFLGSETFDDVNDIHNLAPVDVPQYLEFFADTVHEVTSGNPTRTLLGAMLDSLTLNIQPRAFLKVDGSGVGCDLGADVAALSRDLPANPLSWLSLRAGSIQIGYNGGALSQDTSVRGVKIDFKRTLNTDENIDLTGDQPTGVTAHGRTLEFEITRQFSGSQATSEYNAWKNQQEVAITVNLSANGGTEYVSINIPHAVPVDSYVGEVGASDDSIMATLKCEAFISGTDDLVTAAVKDGLTAAYT